MGVMQEKTLTALFLMVSFLGIQACGGEGGGTTPTSGTFEGTIAGTATTDTTGQTGYLSVVIPVAVAKSWPLSIMSSAYASTGTVTGTLTIEGGSTIILTGTYDDSNGTLTLTGDGGYTFTGTADGSLISGSYDNTGTSFGGGFAGLKSASQVFCGTFVHGSDDSSGLFNLVVTGETVSGVRINYSRKETYKTLSGTRTGDTIDVVVDDNGRRGTGTIVGDTVSGTFTNKQGNLGTFTGSVSECQ